MLGGELLNIHKCQSRKSGEDEYITELSEDPALSIENKHGGTISCKENKEPDYLVNKPNIVKFDCV